MAGTLDSRMGAGVQAPVLIIATQDSDSSLGLKPLRGGTPRCH